MTGSAYAQASKGDKELKLSGSVSSFSNEGSSSTISGNFDFGIGFFITNGFEFGVEPGFSISTTGGEPEIVAYDRFGLPIVQNSPRETSTTPMIRFFGRQHFGRAKVSPYIGANLFSMSTSSGNGNSTSYAYGGIEGGLKNYMSEKTALDLNLSVGGLLNPPEGGTSQTQVVFAIGITHLF